MRHRSHGRIENFSQVFDNSHLRGVIKGSLSVLPFFARRAERLMRAESPSALFVLGAPPILSMLFSSARKRIPIPALSSARKRIPIHAFFLSAQAHTNFCPFLSAQAHTNSCLFLSAQAHTNPWGFSSARKRIPIHTLCPQEFTHVCTSQSRGERGPRPRAFSS